MAKKKPQSGHQGREKARKKKAALVAREWADRYADIGAPPASTVERIEWANRICALLIYEQMVVPELRTTQERKIVLEGVRTLGMTAVKALYESRLKRIEATLYAGRAREELNGSDGLEPDPTAGPARPI
jgi:hypothetical protein